ncbi:sensor domain-containing diguanylate cyclase [Photobacterium iliopiscarium]|nr:sensor domain-containing diguanylate cyclase [Photobacterium iliopiscarium]PSV85288.1 sensor domain-containing diguanylate cyclase [Photobacterium iliopiscarium]
MNSSYFLMHPEVLIMKLKITPSSLAIIISLLLTVVVVEMFFLNEKKQYELLNKKNDLVFEQDVSKIINNEINNLVVSLKTFNLLFKSKSYDVDKFSVLAKEVISTNSSISELQFAPQGIIGFTYPESKHNSAIGHDLNRLTKRHKGVLLSIENQSLTLIGPVKLIQNNRLSFILRLPIFNEQLEFIGFLIALSDLDNISNKLPSGHLFYKIQGFNPDGGMLTIFDNIIDKTAGDITVFNVPVPNGKWMFSIQNKKYNAQKYYIIHLLLYVIVIGFFCYVYKRERQIFVTNTRINNTNNILKRATFTDELTNIYNRRYMNKVMRQIFFANITLTHSIAFLDIDHFKRVNDTYGHDAGDEILRIFSEICLNNIRTTDVIARWGGEEFILFMDQTNKINAEEVCSRILTAVNQHPFLYNDQAIHITVSIGLTSFSPQNDQIELVLQNIDKAVYHSKNNGRNCITVI